MMIKITAKEFFNGLKGAALTCMFRKNTMQYFNTTRAGAIRSFYAAAICIPFLFFAFYNIEDDSIKEFLPGYGFMKIYFVYLWLYVMEWSLFPIIVHQLAKMTEAEDKFLTFLSMHNWTKALRYIIPIAATIILSLNGMHINTQSETLSLATLILGLISIYLIAVEWFLINKVFNNHWFAGFSSTIEVITRILLLNITISLLV